MGGFSTGDVDGDGAPGKVYWKLTDTTRDPGRGPGHIEYGQGMGTRQKPPCGIPPVCLPSFGKSPKVASACKHVLHNFPK